MLVCAFPAIAGAHAVPVAMAPAPNAVVEAAPREATVRFSERVEPRASSLAVLDARGRRVDEGGGRVDPGDPWLFRVALPALEAGPYTVTWRVLSADDGHVTEGAHAFAVGAPAAALPPARVSTTTSGWVVAGRFVAWLGVLGVAGALGGPLLFGRGRAASPGLQTVALGAVVLGETLLFAAQARPVGWLALWPTAVGVVWTAKLGLALAVGALVLARRRGPALAVALAIPVVGAWLSHSAAAPALAGLAIGAHAGHVVGVTLWVGGLAYFATLFWAAGRAAVPALPLVRAIPVFSLAATTGVALLAVTGLYLSRVHVGGVADLVETPYGRLLLAKLVVVALMLGLGAYHQIVVRPRLLGGGDGRPAGDVRATRGFRSAVRLEAALGVVVLLLAATLGTTSPPHRAPAPDGDVFHHHAAMDDARLALEVRPSQPGPNTVRVTVSDPSGGPLGDARAALLQLAPADGGAGPLPLTLAPAGPGVFEARDAVLAIEGRWRGRLVVQRDGAYDLNERFELTLAPADPHAAHRRDGAPLDALTAIPALTIVAGTVALLLRTRRTLAEASAHTPDPGCGRPGSEVTP
jgi:copper transport protein